MSPGSDDEAIASTSVRISTADGASAEVHPGGAHVTSWRPAPGNTERLFLSARTKQGDGVAIRGGIPVIFPQFSNEGPLPRHGFARTSRWELTERAEAGLVAFTLRDSEATRAIWAASFLATLTVRIGGAQLSTTLSVQNTGDQPFHFTAALHTYLRVGDIGQAEIIGLHGGRYRVSSAPGELRSDDEEVLRIDGEVDRVYVDASSRLTLREPARELRIESANFPDVVVWNPGAEKAAALDDMEPGGERRMVCIEAGAIQSPVTLEAGRTWSGSQTLTALPDAPSNATSEASHSASGLDMSPDARMDLALKLQQVEEFIARADSSGEEIPPEAREVVTHLREIVRALEGLTRELGA